MGNISGRLTIDCNGNDFSQHPAVGSLEGRNTTQRVQGLVLGSNVWRDGLDKLDVKVVLFCNG